MTMRVLASLLIVAFFALACGPRVSAQAPAAPVSPQEKVCFQRAVAHQLTGRARERFLSDCLKPADLQTCGARGAEANRQNLKGKKRQLFMSGCLKSRRVS
jgi:hypothetical protein